MIIVSFVAKLFGICGSKSSTKFCIGFVVFQRHLFCFIVIFFLLWPMLIFHSGCLSLYSSLDSATNNELDWIFATLAQQQREGGCLESVVYGVKRFGKIHVVKVLSVFVTFLLILRLL